MRKNSLSNSASHSPNSAKRFPMGRVKLRERFLRKRSILKLKTIFHITFSIYNLLIRAESPIRLYRRRIRPNFLKIQVSTFLKFVRKIVICGSSTFLCLMTFV
nr:hypothetical protein [Leptospira noguchii]